jgi:hypothetical protein
LNIEATYSLARNHNALALELSYRGYPVVPWERVHAGAQTGACHFFNMIEREFQRMTGSRKSVPTDQRIVKLSRRLARQMIPDTRLDEVLSSGLSRELLERVLEIILRAAYLDQDARQRDVESILIDSNLTRQDARKVAVLLVPLFNQLRPTLRINDNAFLSVIRRPSSIRAIKATISAMRQLRTLGTMMNSALSIESDSYVEDYPKIANSAFSNTKLTVIGHCFFYACTRWVLNSREGAVNLKRLAVGKLPMTDLLANLDSLTTDIPKAIGMQYE